MKTLSILFLLGGWPVQDDGPCGLPPEAKRKRIKGGESFAPLPLPATPLRRTERKREPAPPVLVGKLVWGKTHVKTLEGGRKFVWYDWNTDPADTQRLLRFANGALGIQYRRVYLHSKRFSWDPLEVPVVYVQGKTSISFTEFERGKIREYVNRGGAIWADACAGSSVFAQSFRGEMAKVFPGRPLVRLAPDHPLFRSKHKITTVRYSAAARTERADGLPVVEGIYFGCRVAVLLFPYDLSCAWDSFHVPPGGKCIVGSDAIQLGVNLVAYTIGYYNLGRFLSQRRTLEAASDSMIGDFVFAQVRHSGHWDPDPSGFANLLKETLATTNVKVRFGRKQVSLTDPALTTYPFLYLTGHGALRLSEEEASGLKQFLERGGFLLADACCGNLEFDRSFRSLVKQVLRADLKELPREHPVFSTFHRIGKVAYTPQVRASFRDLETPYLEGVQMGEGTRVIYSRFDLGNGWEGVDHPYTFGLESADARKLGVNIILYSMTH